MVRPPLGLEMQPYRLVSWCPWIDGTLMAAVFGLATITAHAAGLLDHALTLPALTVGAGASVIIPTVAESRRRSTKARPPINPLLVAAVTIAPPLIAFSLLSGYTTYLPTSVSLATVGLTAIAIRLKLLLLNDAWRLRRHEDLAQLGHRLLGIDELDGIIAATQEALSMLTEDRASVAVAEATASTAKPEYRHRIEVPISRFEPGFGGGVQADGQPWPKSPQGTALNLSIASDSPFHPELRDFVQRAAHQVSSAIQSLDSRTQAQESEIHRRFDELAQDSHELVAVVDPAETTVLFVGPTLNRLLGYEATDLKGEPILNLVAADDRKQLGRAIGRAGRKQSTARCEARLRKEDGSYQWFAATARFRPGDAAVDSAVIVSFSDINEAKTAEFVIRRAESRYRALVEKSTDMFVLIDENYIIEYVSPNVEQVIGGSHTDLLGTAFTNLLTAEHATGFIDVLSSPQDRLDGMGMELELLGFDGQPRQAQVSVHSSDLPEPDGLLLVLRDITARRRLEENLRSRNLRDQLTGLLSRSAFEVELRRSLSQLGDDQHLGLVVLNLRSFKEVNNAAGFNVGNELLMKVSERLSRSTRADDPVARLAADEFALIETTTSQQDALGFAERIAGLFTEPFTINGRRWDVHVAIGVATTSSRDESPAQMVQAATVALHQAKRKEGTELVLFNQTLQDEVDERFELLSDMNSAITGGEFSVAYQPLLSLNDRSLAGFEALLRWNHPRRGTISPGIFIPLAERSGLIIELGRWVLQRACQQLLDWQRSDELYRNVTMSVNLSARQLQKRDELQNLIQIVESIGMPFSGVTVELTESIVIEDPQGLRAQLNELRSLGMRIAVDDFGTGASGLNHLRELPFDIVKIDKSYTDQVGSKAEGEHLVSQIIELARGLKAKTVAEGIETAEQMELLRDMGCDIGQGFHLARPMEATQVAEWVAGRRHSMTTN